MMCCGASTSICFFLIFTKSMVFGATEYKKDDGDLQLLQSEDQLVTLNWTLTDGDIFNVQTDDIRLNSYCIRNIAQPSMLLRLSANHDYYEGIPDQRIMKYVNCITPGSFSYSSPPDKPNELHVDLTQTVQRGDLQEIEVEKTPRHADHEFVKKSARIKLNRSTRPFYIPVPYPDAGAGCFHVLDANTTSRRVRVYWRRAPDFEVHINIYEDQGDQNVLVNQARGEGENHGSFLSTIGLGQHYFLISSYSRRMLTSRTNVINVPPQREIHPKIVLQGANFDKGTNVNVLRWIKPNHLVRDATNYTIVMVDTVEEKVIKSIFDFVHFIPTTDGDSYTFKVKADRLVKLAISVNTDDSSSGIHEVWQN